MPVGARVDFKNDEKKAVEHNVFSNSEAKKFDLGLYRPGESVTAILFDKPGAVRLRCSIHRYMDGVVYVTPSPYFAAVGERRRVFNHRREAGQLQAQDVATQSAIS